VGRFLIHNFGCRASQADGASLAGSLARTGLRPTSDIHHADLVILNTCTVTSAADQEVRQVVRRVHRQNPDARILVTGCYAQRSPAELAALPGVRWVVGNTHKARIPEILGEEAAKIPFHGQIHVGDIFGLHEFVAAPVEETAGDRTRPNLKIQDGCNNRCSFCIIPSVRGMSRSMPMDRVIDEVGALALRYREIVLSGINLGRWGRDLEGRPRLVVLVDRLLKETEVGRLRLSSVEPLDLSDELLGIIAESRRIARFVHAPLQSGSDAVLRRMRRRYRARHYADRIRKARRLMPEAAIGADVMVGFPGETDAEFEESRRFIEIMPYTYLHVFTYSERPGTPAAALAEPVPMPVRKQRNQVLRELAARKNLEFRERFVGRRLPVVTLADGALSDNYIRVELAVPRPANRLVDVEVEAITAAGLRERSPMTVIG